MKNQRTASAVHVKVEECEVILVPFTLLNCYKGNSRILCILLKTCQRIEEEHIQLPYRRGADSVSILKRSGFTCQQTLQHLFLWTYRPFIQAHGSVSEGSSDKSGKNNLGPVKVRIVMDQMSGNVEAMKTGQEREKIIG